MCIQEYGLLCSKNNDFGAFSPDGIVVASTVRHDNQEYDESSTAHDDQDDGTFCALLEFKTKTKKNTVLPEQRIAKDIGAFVMVLLENGTGGKEFRKAVPEFDHRAQLLHGMACGKLNHAFYVVASETGVIRVVHVKCNENDLNIYNEALEEMYGRAGRECPNADLVS